MMSLETTWVNRTLSLAGVFQAAFLVKNLAKTGQATEPYFTASIESLFKIDAKNTLDVYGGILHLKLGLESLISLFSRSSAPKDADIARYVLSLLHLERKLNKVPNMQKQIQAGILRAQAQASHFSSTHENVMANLSSVYTDTLSTFRFRIYVTGEQVYITQSTMMNKIRALLFAGIRSAVLWHQLGGRRWQFLIFRTKILETAKQLLAEINARLTPASMV